MSDFRLSPSAERGGQLSNSLYEDLEKLSELAAELERQNSN